MICWCLNITGNCVLYRHVAGHCSTEILIWFEVIATGAPEYSEEFVILSSYVNYWTRMRSGQLTMCRVVATHSGIA